MAIDAATVRKVARLARIRVAEERLEPLAAELSGILAWIEQLNEVDTEGVEPMASTVAVPLPMREDVVTDGGDPARDPGQRAQARRATSSWCRRWWNDDRPDRPHAEGRARRPARASASPPSSSPRRTSRPIAAARALNAYVLETPEKALAMAQASDARLARGEAGRWKARRWGSRTCSAPRACASTAGSKILGDFKPTYESTVTANLWRDGAVMLGKLNMDEFAMGSSNETSAFGPVVNPWRSRGSNRAADARRLVRRLGRGGGRRPGLGATATDTGGSIRQPASLHRHGGRSSRPTAAARAGASSPSPPRSTRPGRWPRRSRTPPSCCAR